MLFRTVPRVTPRPLVQLAWASVSTTRTRISAIASAAARLMAVVVFPTPPFWLVIAIVLPIVCTMAARITQSDRAPQTKTSIQTVDSEKTQGMK